MREGTDEKDEECGGKEGGRLKRRGRGKLTITAVASRTGNDRGREERRDKLGKSL